MRIFAPALAALLPLVAALAAPPPNLKAAVPDAQVEREIRAKLARGKLAADKFTVRVQGGVATFEGRTNVVQHKGAATRIAKSSGARAVVNNIQISEEARRKARERMQANFKSSEIRRGEVRRAK